MGFGVWGWGFGGWGIGPNPQSPIPIFFDGLNNEYINYKKLLIYGIKINIY
jgi:hypothetical protein